MLVGTATTGTRTSPATSDGQRALHPGDRDRPRWPSARVGARREHAMDARDADIEEARDAVAHHLGADRGLLGHAGMSAVPALATTMWPIGGPRLAAVHEEDLRPLEVARVVRDLRDGLEVRRGGPRAQHHVAVVEDLARDRRAPAPASCPGRRRPRGSPCAARDGGRSGHTTRLRRSTSAKGRSSRVAAASSTLVSPRAMAASSSINDARSTLELRSGVGGRRARRSSRAAGRDRPVDRQSRRLVVYSWPPV